MEARQVGTLEHKKREWNTVHRPFSACPFRPLQLWCFCSVETVPFGMSFGKFEDEELQRVEGQHMPDVFGEDSFQR